MFFGTEVSHRGPEAQMSLEMANVVKVLFLKGGSPKSDNSIALSEGRTKNMKGALGPLRLGPEGFEK